ncbi:isochorismate synthase [Rhabdobacter roseus]|uniref:isochorismate synthase n=1 Tax=Rhabdobacter roseus TaxID=1655419 RepID=A0A840TJ88_9BACT|nr:chorismate-binding protein [Rhabdobacter roseus]MBB5282995.1 isochorismate synthase [Rhabdobacter roseus]
MIDQEITTPEPGVISYQAQSLWDTAQALGFPAAIWRLPHRAEAVLLVSLREQIARRQPDLEALPTGFLLSPFLHAQPDEVLFLEGDLIFTLNESGQVLRMESPLGEEHPLVRPFLDAAAQVPAKAAPLAPTHLHPLNDEVPVPTGTFQNAVAQAVAAIREGYFDKVVLSRTKTLTYADDFPPLEAFQRLCRAYPTAFVSLVRLPERDEMWLGATPETLVELDANRIFRTIALAGTQRASTESGTLLPRQEVRWGQKEIEEQALVSRYIIECFKKIRLREYLERGPKTVLAGNLYHLQTEFEVDTQEVNFPELGTVMLRLLHPTSAVCGTPKEPALRFLTSVEGYDRSFYSGYLGPVNVERASNLYVNLRTMRLAQGVATVFAGAGITEDSDPEREWEETELKCQTLLRVLAPDPTT